MQLAEISIFIASLAVFSYIAAQRKSLSNRGIVAALIVGIVVFVFGGIASYLALLVFYIVAQAATTYSRNITGKSHEQRRTSNVIGNSGAALIALAFGQQLAFFGAIAAALADTISGEIGLLSKKKPILITSLKEVEAGTDGGITALGIFAGAIASLVIAAAYYFISGNFNHSAIIFAAGIVGMVVDSILGDVFERKGRLNNMQVNFIASLCGAAATVLLKFMF
jgi:uncharacterized protein (TIGR00297 family)